MATAAERQRRSRAHRRDDHRWCEPRSCNAATATPVEDGGPDRVPGGIETTTQAFVDALPYSDDDPRHLLGQIAVLLARRVDEDGAVPAAVRELRTLLMQLAEAPNGPSGFVDEGRLRRAQRRLDGILAQVR